MANISASTAESTQVPPKSFPTWRLTYGVKNATDDQLEEASESCERWGWACGVIVVLGVAAEFWITAAHPQYGTFWERWGTAYADALVALGVAGEIMFSRLGSIRQKELVQRSNDRLTQMEFESGFAQERAAQMEKEAAAAKLETQRLKSEVAWRTLDANVFHNLVAELSQNPSRVTLVFVSGDPETTAYCAYFVEAFRRANWQVEIVGRMFLGPPIGIYVTHGDTWSDRIQVEIERVRRMFVDAGIQVEPGGGSVDVRAPGFAIGKATAEIRIIIGHKPAPNIQ